MSINTGPNIITDGLLIYLDASNPKSYNETSSTWQDLSGNKKNATLINGPTYSTDNNGILTFDGVDDTCRFPSSTFTSESPQEATFSLFIKIPISTGVGGVLFSDGGSTGQLIYFYRNAPWGTNQFSWLIYYNTPTGSASILSNITYNPNNWYNTVLTFNTSGQYKVYVNGQLISTVNANNFVSWRRSGTAQPFINPSTSAGTGSISIFQYYNRAIELQEIQQNFNAIKSRFEL